MGNYIFEMSYRIDILTTQEFEAVVCWEHCQMFYQPVYDVRTIAGSDKPCPFCQLQGRLADRKAGVRVSGIGSTNPKPYTPNPVVDTGQMSLFATLDDAVARRGQAA